MKESRRTNALIAVALAMIAAAFGLYSLIMMSWLRAPARQAAGPAAARAEAEQNLASARKEFRARLLDPRAHMRLSNALWKAGRPVDSFYVLYAARQLFADDAFRRAHAEVVLGAGGPAAEARKRLEGLRDAALTVPVHAEVAREHPDTPEGRMSLDALSRLAAGDENSAGGESARLARTALDELHQDDPKHPGKLAALGMGLFARGDHALAHAVATEALSKNPDQAGAAQIMGALALQQKDMDGAMRWLSASWDRNPDDLYSASKLAQIYDKRRADPESALPFYLALYRQNPDFADAGEPVERRIRETLDARRESLLKHAPVEGLGTRFALDDASLRAEACLRAAAFKDPRWVERLGELLDDDAEIVRRNADYALFEIGKADGEAVRSRRDAWLGSDKPLVRIRALNLFADLDGRNVLPKLADALRDPNPAVRGFAKVMVLDHYFAGAPEATKLRARYLAEERDPEVLSLLSRFPAK
ncbi:MAG: tetratricopeptide repeat protein [Elusimicrobiota bacterium]|nr:MAG: tetratricopeptide repeat protein [Elusimicrobiota bacterium]